MISDMPTGSGDEIWVAAGTYEPDQDEAGKSGTDSLLGAQLRCALSASRHQGALSSYGVGVKAGAGWPVRVILSRLGRYLWWISIF